MAQVSKVELHPFSDHPAAAAMLHLARGQLNRAYRLHGLPSPDPLCRDTCIDDPVAEGVGLARERFGEAFAKWEAEMPADLVEPVLQILQEACAVLSERPELHAAEITALEASALLQRLQTALD